MLPHPVIPAEEYAKRWEQVQRILQSEQLDLIIAYADDRATYGAAYARYFANFAVHFEPVLLLFIKGSEPILLCGPETVSYAALTGRVRDVRALKEFAAEHEDYPFTTLEPLKDIAGQALGFAPKRIGIAPVQHMGAYIFETVKRTFSDAELIHVDDALDSMRSIKSPAELNVIRRAYEIANAGMTAAIDAVKPGVTEREVAAKAEYAMRIAGSEGTGIDTIVASGENTRPILARTTMREIQQDDLVLITVAPRYEGYHGAVARTLIVGDPGKKAVDAVKAEVRAQEICAANLFVGRRGSEVEAMGRKVMADAGYGENFLYSGLHSVGVIEFEPPIMGPSSNTVIADNMVISIDIPLFESDIFGSRTEDGYIIQNGQAECLTPIPRLIRK